VGCHRKVHHYHTEKKYFAAGSCYPVFETETARIGILICYDFEFPETARILALKGADFIFVPLANSNQYETDQATYALSRALENHVFMVLCNRTGTGYFGKSCIVDPAGKIIAQAGYGEELIYGELDTKLSRRARYHVDYFRDRRPDTYGLVAQSST
jgi:predicted amidohydrolase